MDQSLFEMLNKSLRNDDQSRRSVQPRSTKQIKSVRRVCVCASETQYGPVWEWHDHWWPQWTHFDHDWLTILVMDICGLLSDFYIPDLKISNSHFQMRMEQILPKSTISIWNQKPLLLVILWIARIIFLLISETEIRQNQKLWTNLYLKCLTNP